MSKGGIAEHIAKALVEEIRKLVNIKTANEVRRLEYICILGPTCFMLSGFPKRSRLKDHYMARPWQTTSLE